MLVKVDLYALAVTANVRALDTLAHLLTKGSEFAAAQGVSEGDMLEWRLAPDMNPLRFQLVQVINHTSQWAARAAGVEVPPQTEAASLADIQAALAKAKAQMTALSPAQLAGRDEVKVKVPLGPMEPELPLGQWMINFAMPNIMFHLTTAYAILRQRGVEIGKRDFFPAGF